MASIDVLGNVSPGPCYNSTVMSVLTVLAECVPTALSYRYWYPAISSHAGLVLKLVMLVMIEMTLAISALMLLSLT